MIVLKTLTAEQIRTVLREREFGSDVTGSAAHVAVVLTQGWCSQWRFLDAQLSKAAAVGEPEDGIIHVYVFVYNESEFFEEFLPFKETVFGNLEIPYVRYYRDGIFADESNYVSISSFMSRFT